MDETIHISVTKDKMEAYMVFSAPDLDGDEMPIERVLAMIENARIVFGVNEDYIRTLYAHREYEREYKIAEGKPPVDGADGRVEFSYDFDKINAPKIDVYGNVDYFNTDRYISVKQGDVLAEYIPAKQGVSGMDVHGAVVKAKNGKPARIPIGKNVKVAENTNNIVAKIDGLLELIDGRLYVEPVLYISGDVDLSTGNIDFIGNVQIRGGVRSGMVVKAQGNVDVNGMVESATIISNGDITLNGGIKGNGKAEVRAKGNISARYIESATIHSEGVVKSTSILQSNIYASDGVEVIGSRGYIIGGDVHAGNYVDCKCIGSSNNPPTHVTVGMPPELKKEMSELEAEVKVYVKEIKELDKAASIPDAGLTPQQKLIKERLVAERREKSYYMIKKKARIQEIQESMEVNKRSYISVQDTVFVGAVIAVNHATLNVRSDYKFTTFRERDGEVVATQHA